MKFLLLDALAACKYNDAHLTRHLIDYIWTIGRSLFRNPLSPFYGNFPRNIVKYLQPHQ